MPRKKTFEVKLSEAQRNHLENLNSAGTAKARMLTRARILLKADEEWTDKAIEEALDVSRPTVERTRKRFVKEGFEIALRGKPSSRQYETKLDGKAEAHLLALVCSEPPAGYARWTLRLLADRLVKLEQVEVETICHETIRRTLKKMNLSLGRTVRG